MKVRDLKQVLAHLRDDVDIVISTDGHGEFSLVDAEFVRECNLLILDAEEN